MALCCQDACFTHIMFSSVQPFQRANEDMVRASETETN